jgi:glycosyltransferase involved in cell wall biosynthesis
MLGINASIVGEHPTGLGIYSIKLIQELDWLRRDFCVYTSAPEAFPALGASLLPAPAATRPGRGARGHLARLFWLQGILRVKAGASRLRLLLNTVPEGILRSSTPQITVVHDLLPLAFPAEYPRQQYYFRYFVPRILHSSRLVVTDSQFTRRTVIDRYGLPPGNVRVVYPGHNPDVYQANGSPPQSGSGDDEYVLYVGNLLPHKNVLGLLDAVAILRRRRPVRLVIRGEGRPTYVRAVRARVEMLGMEGVVTFLGYTTEKTMRDLYSRAACLVLPSLGEGFGLPVLEAMACGTPVVTAAVSSLPEVAGDAALMVNPHDSLEVAEAMFRILSDPDLRQDLRERGLRQAAGFTWRRTGEGISRLLDETLA